jgi:hypothetical protein
MKNGILNFSVICSLLGSVLCSGVASAQSPALTPYYFPEGDVCTLALDFQPRRSEIEAASKDSRSVILAESLLREYSTQGSEKCPGAKTVKLLAILIPGVDSYGRPNFAGRVNLLRLEGSSEQVNAVAKSHPQNPAQLQELLTVTIY